MLFSATDAAHKLISLGQPFDRADVHGSNSNFLSYISIKGDSDRPK